MFNEILTYFQKMGLKAIDAAATEFLVSYCLSIWGVVSERTSQACLVKIHQTFIL
jgi:hypothetical protein